MSPPPDLPPPDPLPPPPPPDPPPPHRVSLSLMVVPEGAPTSKLRVQKRDLIFKFVGKYSMGVAERHYGKRRAPLINDLHVAKLYSDKVSAERELRVLQVERNALVHERDFACEKETRR